MLSKKSGWRRRQPLQSEAMSPAQRDVVAYL